MRPSDVLRRATGYLERHGVESPRETAEVLMMTVLRTDRARLYSRSAGLSSAEARLFGRALCQRCAGTPLQHLTGEQPFRRISVRVQPGVFIPRPETEALVGEALDELGDVDDPVVVDVGTGTGAVALAIKDERPGAKVFATDLSPEAVELARANAARLSLQVTVVEGDLLDPLPAELRGWVDLVVSNPPYVTEEELQDLPAEVRAEPRLALVGGTQLYERLAIQALRWLRDGGVLAVEIGGSPGADVAKVLEGSYMDVRTLPDLAGRDRIVVARRP
ncbi:MAG TPA: peptide chain release factor N(5)-glutamine methyltransferase [Methylomirabilota bacterium]|nr:peptide chain release factor N(5)-glutamine methyltransferase [Methylomirabilota bacterium]